MSSKTVYPGPLDLPVRVVSSLVSSLDSPAVHNWKSLVEHLPGRTQHDVQKFKNVRHYGGSPSKELLKELHSEGWTILDLCKVSRESGIMAVVETLVQYCQDVNLDARPLTADVSIPSWKSARSCGSRSGYPGSVAPPLHAGAEAVKRYKLKNPEKTDLVVVDDSLAHVAYAVILASTGGLSPVPHSAGGSKLGEGGFGEVFYCRLDIKGQETETAVKVLRKREDQGQLFGSVNREQFNTEVDSLSKLSHDHLLSVLGYSSDGDHLCLIYPFLQRGSLDKYVTDHTLTADRRVSISVGVASGLDYLHSGVDRELIVHRDVKSANVLLSTDWTAKLGDFGVARVIPDDSSVLMTTTIVGTTIFMAPEYRTGTVTPKADVYSLGVVLFELLTGRSALDRVTMATGEETDLVTFILELEDEPADNLIGQWDVGVADKVWSIAESCLEQYEFKRPSSNHVFNELKKLSN